MAEKSCSVVELEARCVELAAELKAFRELMDERDKRYEQRSASQDNSVENITKAAKEAVDKAAISTEKRLEALNELRGMVEDQARAFARKAETGLLVEGLEKRIDVLKEGLEKRIDVLTTLVNMKEGRGTGLREAVGYMVAAVGLGIAAVAAFFHR